MPRRVRDTYHKIGELLVRKNLAPPEAIDEALALQRSALEQKKTPPRLGEDLPEITGKKAAMLALLSSLCLCASGASSQEDRQTVRKVGESIRPSLLGIEITLRKKTRLEKAEIEEEGTETDARQLILLADNQQTLDLWGVAVEKDLILIADRSLETSDIEKIEAIDAAGARFEVRVHAVGRNHDFVLLKPVAARELAPLAFGDWEPPALGEYFYVTTADTVDARWHLNVSPYIQTNAPLVETKEWLCADSLRTGAVISNAKGVPVGIALDQHLWVRPDGRSSFLGKAILADERIGDLDAKYAGFRRELPASVLRVELALRAERASEFMPQEETKSGRVTVFGVALDDRGTLFVPHELTRDVVRKIEDIKVLAGDRTYPGHFVGSFRAFGGLIIRAEGAATRPGIPRDPRVPVPGEILFTATVEDRFGRDRTKFGYNRVFRTEKGLKGQPRPQPRKRIKAGSFLLDFEGRVIGCVTTDRKEEDFDEMAAEAARDRFFERYRASYTPDYLRRLLFFPEIADVLSKPQAHFDPRAVPMTKREEKKLVWLGVEFQEISKPIAEALGIQETELTNDGRRGLIVTAVYPSSPAAKAGLREDDILLSVQPEGEAARDLIAEPERYTGMRRNPFDPRGQTGPPWRPTRNYLTSVLTEIGAGRKVVFDYARGRQRSRAEVGLEYAPTDYETAEKFKDDALGFTVKELTYEVRHFNRLDDEVAGVVVARVESGSKAEVAKLAALSIVCRVNDVAVRDLAHFKELLAAPKNLTLTAIAFGQSKLVELSRD